jgi:lipopolysaccharide export LptBFGC system permease protein LptF
MPSRETLPPIVMTTEIRSTLRPAILGFVITLIVMSALLTTQFLLRYGADIFGNNIGTSAVFEIISLGILGFMEYAFPISVFVMTTIYYRHLARKENSIIRIKPTLLTSSLFAIVGFIYIAYVLPVIQLHEVRLLYDIRAKEINAPLEKTNLAFFKGNTLTSNYSELKRTADSIYNYTIDKKSKVFDYVKENNLTGKHLEIYEEMFNQDIQENNAKINKMRTRKAQMTSFPFLIFVLFYSGMFLGILNKGNRLWLLLISIYLTVLPGIYYLSRHSEKLSKDRTLTPFQSQFFFITTILLITIGLYWYTRRHLKEERTTGGNTG